jgi:hypothetical protein
MFGKRTRRVALSVAAAVALAAGCSRVAERDPWPEARAAAREEAAAFWFDDARDTAERFTQLPHPTAGTIRSLNGQEDRDLSLPESSRPGVPILRLAVLEVCPADLRRVEFTYLEWNRDFIPHPRRFRTESWHELHGCAD